MKNQRVAAKIFFSFMIVIVMTVLLGIVALMQVNTLGTIANGYASETMWGVDHLWSARRAILQNQTKVVEATIVMTAEELDVLEGEIAEAAATLDSSLQSLLQYYPEFAPQVEEVNTLMENVSHIRAKLLIECRQFTTQGNENAYEIYTQEYVPAFDQVANVLLGINDKMNESITADYYTTRTTMSMAGIMVIVLLVAAVAVTLVMTGVLNKAILTPVKQIETAMEQVAHGDFKDVAIDYQSKDELGKLSDSVRATVEKLDVITNDLAYICDELSQGNFTVRTKRAEVYTSNYAHILSGLEQVRDNLTDTMVQIDMSSSQVLSGAQQVADGSQGLAQGATEQASSVQELLASMNEMQHRVKENTENALTASRMSGEAGAGVMESNRVMGELMNAMGEINETSNQISRVIKSIDDIAFQTNILALNAAVEAARAGTAGKGFSVVADEVRSLAGKSAEAVKTTTELIQNTLNAIAKGNDLAQATSAALHEIVTKASEVDKRIGEISAASAEQKNAVDQMTIGIEQISAVVQSTSATAEESAAASEELSGQANILKELIGHFRLDEGEGHAAPLQIPKEEPAYTYSAPAAEFAGGSDKY